MRNSRSRYRHVPMTGARISMRLPVQRRIGAHLTLGPAAQPATVAALISPSETPAR